MSLIHAIQAVDDFLPWRPHRAVEAAREYLALYPQRNDSISGIAAAAHCSAFHLARMFRRQTGQSLHAYRTQRRMALALERLGQGENNLSALAADLGFSSHSHLGVVFRRCFGASLSQVRTKLIARNKMI